jgi:hypothetical protein
MLPDDVGHGWCRRRAPRLIETLVAMTVAKPRLGNQEDMDDLFHVCSVNDATSYPGTFCLQWCGEFEWLPGFEPIRIP